MTYPTVKVPLALSTRTDVTTVKNQTFASALGQSSFSISASNQDFIEPIYSYYNLQFLSLNLYNFDCIYNAVCYSKIQQYLCNKISMTTKKKEDNSDSETVVCYLSKFDHK